MNLLDLAKTVAKFAPVLGAVIPIPGAAAIGNLIGLAFGGSTDNVPDLVSKIGADPDASVKLKEIESNCSVQLHQIQANIALAQIQADSSNMTSARDMQMTIKSRTPTLLSFIISVAFFALIMFLCVGDVPADNKDVLNILLGALSLQFGHIMSYWFGSSDSSESKDKMLYNSTPGVG